MARAVQQTKKRAASGGREPRSLGGFRMSQADHTLGVPDWESLMEKRHAQ